MATLMGIETEYGFTALDGAGNRLTAAAGDLLQAMRVRWPHLRDAGAGIFLANAARFYLDQGKPELCTPECADPSDVVRYVRAGEHMLESTAATLVGADVGIAEILLQRCNVDYGGMQTTWGCHESYLYECMSQAQMAPQLLPHLASRVIYTGAGGFNSRASHLLQFTLSPRAWHLECDISLQSTRHRALFHTKDEPLASRSHRLHLLCGESNCSDTALWLKVGTTALIVALIDSGFRFGDGVALSSPVAALRHFASDPTCRATALTANGAAISALDIQQHYLECVEAQIAHGALPAWAPAVCRRWRSVLEQLRGAPQAVATSLDWGIKYALYVEHARRRGLSWELVPLWNAVAQELAAAWERRVCSGALTYAAICDPASPIARKVRRLAPMLHDHGLRWEDFEVFLAVRQELCEIDTRFGQLNGTSIFAALDRAGVLAHRVEGVDGVGRAVDEPPAGGRAALRGRLVRELHHVADRYRCDWTGVVDQLDDRWIDLQNPFATTAEWQPRPPRECVSAQPDLTQPEALLRDLQQIEVDCGAESVDVALACNQLGVCLRNLGRPADAEPYQRRALAIDERLREPSDPKIPHRTNNLAVVLVMQRKLDEAKPLLARAWHLKHGAHDLTSARVAWVRLAVAMLEHASPRVFLGQVKSLFGLSELPAYGEISLTWDYEPIVASLAPGLDASEVELLKRIAAALNSRHRVLTLAELLKWRTTRPVSLDFPWPE